MINSITGKTLFIIGITITVLFMVVGYLFIQNDNALMEKIRINNLNNTMETIDTMQAEQLRLSKDKIKSATVVIANNSAIFLYNYDKSGLEDSLKISIDDNSIKAVKVWDAGTNEIFLVAFKKNNEIVIANKLAKDFNKYTLIENTMYAPDSDEKDILGKAILYYDDSDIKIKILKLKKKMLNEINKFNISIDKEKSESDIVKSYIAICFLIIILFSIGFLINKFVKKPLYIFKEGLQSFFDYLADPRKNLKTIDIDTTDEFGQMTKSVNESIQVSIKLHKELFELNNNLEIKIEERTTELSKSNKNIRASIKYASLIQEAILPEQASLDKYVNGHFVFWQPRDTVGGDIYFIIELDSKEEIIVMIIDGAGHGVPGAFVTMLVKAIENQITAEIRAKTLEPNPALILEYFNRSIKTMLKQEKNSRSNAGFDGGVLYYNKTTNECQYAGAKTPLYIINDNKLEIIKSDRHNVGFKRTKIDQEYTSYIINIKPNTKLYIATDGLIDQEGLNDTTYGKKEFERLIIKLNEKPMDKQKDEIMKVFNDYKANLEQRDDVTIVGLRF